MLKRCIKIWMKLVPEMALINNTIGKVFAFWQGFHGHYAT